jgi:hypothetical protein
VEDGVEEGLFVRLIIITSGQFCQKYLLLIL